MVNMYRAALLRGLEGSSLGGQGRVKETEPARASGSIAIQAPHDGVQEVLLLDGGQVGEGHLRLIIRPA